MFNLHFPKISDFLCAHTHTWGRSMVFHLVVCSMGYWPWCYSWTICHHFLANAVHGVTACDMGLLLGTWGYCLWKVQKHSFEVISKYFDYLLGTQKTLCLGTTCVFRKISFFFRFFAALKVCWKFVANFQSNFQWGCKFDWNFQCKLSRLDCNFQCKLSRLDWKFNETCRVTLKLSVQTFIESCNPALEVCIESFSQTCNPPPGSLTESLQQTCNKLSGQQKNYRKKLVFFKEIMFS